MIIKAAKRIFNSDKICRSYSDLNFGVIFLEHSVDSLDFTSAESLDLHCVSKNIPDILAVTRDNIVEFS